MSRIIGIMLSLLVLAGCGTHYTVNVDGLSTSTPVAANFGTSDAKPWRAVIRPLDVAVSPDDLLFIACAGQLRAALPAGKFEIKEDTPTGLSDADGVIFLGYTVSGPQVETTVTAPPYWRTPFYFYNGFRASGIALGFEPAYPVVTSETSYTYDLHLVACELLHTGMPPETGKQIWKLDATSTRPERDPRKMFPIMLAAMQPYFGKDTGGLLNVTVENEQSPQVVKVK